MKHHSLQPLIVARGKCSSTLFAATDERLQGTVKIYSHNGHTKTWSFHGTRILRCFRFCRFCPLLIITHKSPALVEIHHSKLCTPIHTNTHTHTHIETRKLREEMRSLASHQMTPKARHTAHEPVSFCVSARHSVLCCSAKLVPSQFPTPPPNWRTEECPTIAS